MQTTPAQKKEIRINRCNNPVLSGGGNVACVGRQGRGGRGSRGEHRGPCKCAGEEGG